MRPHRFYPPTPCFQKQYFDSVPFKKQKKLKSVFNSYARRTKKSVSYILMQLKRNQHPKKKSRFQKHASVQLLVFSVQSNQFSTSTEFLVAYIVPELQTFHPQDKINGFNQMICGKPPIPLPQEPSKQATKFTIFVIKTIHFKLLMLLFKSSQPHDLLKINDSVLLLKELRFMQSVRILHFNHLHLIYPTISRK